MTSTLNRLGQVLVHLPALEPPANYDGTVELHVTTLVVQLDPGQVELQGSWLLHLEGPSAAELKDQLRVEAFAPVPLAIVGGAAANITGLRSRSETRLVIALPEGVLILSQPLLRVGDVQLAPRALSVVGNEATASFDPTPFGQAVVVELGALALADAGSPHGFTVDFADLLSQANGAATFAVPSNAILSGEPSLIVRGEQGTALGRAWVGLELAGNWHPENGKPVITDAGGSTLDLAHMQVGYQKDANGTIREGSTAIGFFVEGETDLSRVTILLGARSLVDGPPRVATLSPVAD